MSKPVTPNLLLKGGMEGDRRVNQQVQNYYILL